MSESLPCLCLVKTNSSDSARAGVCKPDVCKGSVSIDVDMVVLALMTAATLALSLCVTLICQLRAALEYRSRTLRLAMTYRGSYCSGQFAHRAHSAEDSTRI
ncbi:uncharacterized [Tachysurus ichikawai]